MNSDLKQTHCDIIIPVWNRIYDIRACLKSILINTNCDFRLIIVDDNSSIDTASYLSSFADKHKKRTMLLKNKKNVGYVKSVNLGVKATSSSYVCFLNSDTVVGEKWLTNMILAAEYSKRIGIVNPNSNNFGLKEKGLTVSEMAKVCSKGPSIIAEQAAASGFCMLIKREVINKIGLLDECFGVGFFEDADYSFRAKEAGYMCVRALRAYVNHRQHASFNEYGDWENHFEQSREIFEKKWWPIEKTVFFVEKKYTEEDCNKIVIELSKILYRGEGVIVAGSKSALGILLDAWNKAGLPSHVNLKCSINNKIFGNIRYRLRNLIKKKKISRFVSANEFLKTNNGL